ncbi:hypothetical protein ACIBL3_34035 [Kribbella sp. NPDC050124]|uniref:hypothetical protein n=1 Tax=Kribbella sp. NPDC050124 TaxID=3364114 RepID=UPI0037BC16AD
MTTLAQLLHVELPWLETASLADDLCAFDESGCGMPGRALLKLLVRESIRGPAGATLCGELRHHAIEHAEAVMAAVQPDHGCSSSSAEAALLTDCILGPPGDPRAGRHTASGRP